MMRRTLTSGLAAALLVASVVVSPARGQSGSEGKATVEELQKMLASPDTRVLVLDVRGGEIESKIKGAAHIPLDELEARMKELPRDREIITYCA